jgi:hypothetical protein
LALSVHVCHLSDDEIYALNRGGHDPFKVFQAYRAAKQCSDKPTVILAKTVKGYGMGEAGAQFLALSVHVCHLFAVLCWLVKVKLFNIFFGYWNIKTLFMH